MIYDIQMIETAQKTLQDITGISLDNWVTKHNEIINNECTNDDFLRDMIDREGRWIDSYKDLTFVYSHITTSANECKSLFKHGLLDLKKAYSCKDSELRQFLDSHNIEIDLEKCLLNYNGEKYDISYTPKSDCDFDNYEKNKRDVGRKFFSDYSTCGFLSVCKSLPYGGDVHKCPEILNDLDRLLKLNLVEEWKCTHKPYRVIAKVSGENIFYYENYGMTEHKKILDFVEKAYYNAFYEISENVLVLNKGISISPNNIVEIKPLDFWH